MYGLNPFYVLGENGFTESLWLEKSGGRREETAPNI